MAINIILFEPEIPQNTGNIIRTCDLSNSQIFLVKPLGFSLSSRMVKKSGMDYIKNIKINLISNLDDFLENKSFYFLSTKGKKLYTQASFKKDDFLIFGSESKGLPDRFIKKWKEKFLKIPMKTKGRSLNLANSVSIVLYEALRQLHFSGLK